MYTLKSKTQHACRSEPKNHGDNKQDWQNKNSMVILRKAPSFSGFRLQYKLKFQK